MQGKRDIYNDYALEYAKLVEEREQKGIEQDPIMPRFLAMIGEVDGLTILDAACGEGYLSRILAQRGANVTGIDLAPRLIELARAKNQAQTITYHVADLSQPQPAYQDHFDLIVSHLALDDVRDYQDFLHTLGTLAKPGGRLILSMNNPYSFIVRGHLTDYFGTGGAYSYRGMAEQGVKVHFYHQTLEEYLDACFAAGFQLQRLADIPTPESSYKRTSAMLIPGGVHFPFFIILSLVKM